MANCAVLPARSNGRLLGPLLDAADDMKPGTARLLRLLCRPLFHSRVYTRRVRIARGAYAEVLMLWPPSPPIILDNLLCIAVSIESHLILVHCDC